MVGGPRISAAAAAPRPLDSLSVVATAATIGVLGFV